LSLADIATKASPTAVGVYIGYEAAGGHTPLLLLTVPAGMIICGAAGGLARGLEEGIREKIKKMLSAKRSRPPKKP
jgi:hypothetical protein